MKENKVVFTNGLFDAARSQIGRLPDGVVLKIEGGFELLIPDKVIVEEMVHLVFLAEKNTADLGEAVFPVKIRAGISTRLNVVLHKTGAFNFGPKNITVEIFLSENACVDYTQIEEAGVKGHFSTVNKFHLKIYQWVHIVKRF